jgi:hypothetical protein
MPKDRELERGILTEIMQSTYNYLPDDLLQFAVDISMHTPAASDSLAGHVLEVSHEAEEESVCLMAQNLGLTAVESGDITSQRTRMLVGIGQCVMGPRHSLEESISSFPFAEQLLDMTEPLCARFEAVASSLYP